MLCRSESEFKSAGLFFSQLSENSSTERRSLARRLDIVFVPNHYRLLLLLLLLRVVSKSVAILAQAFGSSRHLGSNPRGQVVSLIPVTTSQWFPGHLPPRLSGSRNFLLLVLT